MGLKVRLNFGTHKKLLALFILILILIPLSFLSLKATFVKPKVHSVAAFSSKVEQAVFQQDILIGKGIPNAKVSISITPSEIKQEIAASSKGDWSYTIPKNIKGGSYNLTVLILDTGGSIASIKSYPIKIEVRTWKLPKFGFNVWAQASSNTAIYVDPTSGNLGQTFTVTATGIPSCSANYNFNPGAGLSSCSGGCGQGGRTDGCICSGGNPKDSNACWWRWTCSANTAGNFTAGFNASGTGCFSNASYSVNTPQASSQPSGQISATPSHFELQQGQLGSTVIAWSTTNATNDAQVRVYEPTNITCSPTNKCTFAEGLSGLKAFTTVETNHTYKFDLYDGQCTKPDCSDRPLLGSTIVTTSLTCSSTNRTCPAGSVCNAAQFSSGYCIPQTPSPSPEPRELEALGPEYQDWVARMKRLSIYPARDMRTREIVFVSREDFQEQVCNNDPSCISPRYDEFINGIKNHNFDYIIALGDKLREHPNCYVAFEALQPYFGDNDFLNTDNFGSLLYLNTPNLGCGEGNHQISEEDLARFIHETAVNYSQDKDDPNHDFFTTTETASFGFFPSSVILKLIASRDGYNPDAGLAADTAFAIANFVPIAKVGGAVRQVSRVGSHAITNRTTVDLSRLTAQMRQIRELIQSKAGLGLRRGEKVSQETVQTQIDNTVERNLRELPPTTTWVPIGPIPEGLRPRSVYALELFNRALAPHLGTLVKLANRDLVEQLGSDAVAFANNFAQSTGRNIALNPLVKDALDNNRVFVILDDGMFNNLKRNINPNLTEEKIRASKGFYYGDMIIFRENHYYLYADRGALQHEIWHLLEPYVNNTFGVQPNSPLFEPLRLVYEVMHDYAADVMRGIVPFREGSYSSIGYAATTEAGPIAKGIFDRLVRKYPDLLDDFIEFSIMKDGPKLIATIGQRTGRGQTTEEFLRWFVEDAGINPNAIKPYAYAGATGVALVVGAELRTLFEGPAIEVRTDIFIGGEDEEVEIIGAPDQAEMNDNINVSVLETESGLISSHADQLKEAFTIQHTPYQGGIFKTAYAQGAAGSISTLNALPAQEIYPQTYQITIPDNTNPGTYCLKAYLYSQGSDEILDESECHALAIEVEPPEPSPPPLEVVSIKINGVDMDLNTLSLNLHLPGTEGQAQSFAIPLEVTYSDGHVDHLAYNFNYNPPTLPTPTPIPTLTPSPQLCTYSEAPQGCSYGGTRTCTGSLQDGVCKYDPDIDPNCHESCNPPPAPQCTTSCGRDNGQNCTNQNKANTECADYYEDESTCSYTNAGPRGDGCIP